MVYYTILLTTNKENGYNALKIIFIKIDYYNILVCKNQNLHLWGCSNLPGISLPKEFVSLEFSNINTLYYNGSQCYTAKYKTPRIEKEVVDAASIF